MPEMPDGPADSPDNYVNAVTGEEIKSFGDMPPGLAIPASGRGNRCSTHTKLL
jgi:hypothetical protein